VNFQGFHFSEKGHILERAFFKTKQNSDGKIEFELKGAPKSKIKK